MVGLSGVQETSRTRRNTKKREGASTDSEHLIVRKAHMDLTRSSKTLRHASLFRRSNEIDVNIRKGAVDVGDVRESLAAALPHGRSSLRIPVV
jgi:hypothetical protein